MLVSLVGTRFRPIEAQTLARSLKEGDEVRLIRESTNKYDKNAVAVLFGDMHIGYVPKTHNEVLAQNMDAEPDAEFIATVDSNFGLDIFLSIEDSLII